MISSYLILITVSHVIYGNQIKLDPFLFLSQRPKQSK